MARGNRTHSQATRRRAATTTATASAAASPTASVPIPAASSDIAAALDAARRKARDHVARYEEVIAGDSKEMPYPRPASGGGLHNHTGLGAIDLVQLSLWAQAAGDPEASERILDRARVHQDAHLQTMEDLGQWQNTGSHYGVRQSEPPGATQAAAQWLRDEIDRLADPQARREAAAEQRVLLDAFAAEQHITPALESIMDRLAAGDERGWEDAAAIFAELGEAENAALIMNADAATRDRMNRMLVGNALISHRSAYRSEYLSDLRTAIHATEEDLMTAARERAAGDAWEEYEFQPLRANLGRGLSAQATRGPMESATQATALMRRYLRAAAPIDGGLHVRAVLAKGAFADTVTALGATTGVAPRVEVVACPHPRRRNERVMLGVAHLDVVVDGRPVRHEFSTVLGTTTSEKPEFHIKRATKEFGDLGFTQRTETRTKVGYNLELLGQAELLPAHTDTSTWPALSADDTYGPERCLHANAVTSRNATNDALIIACADCQRSRVAVIPFHRLPENRRRERIDDDERYLGHERGYALLTRTSAPPSTLAEIARRDGEAPLTPAAYAIGVAPVKRGGRSGSLRAQLAGR